MELGAYPFAVCGIEDGPVMAMEFLFVVPLIMLVQRERPVFQREQPFNAIASFISALADVLNNDDPVVGNDKRCKDQVIHVLT
jgi:hypothetical protein